MNFPERHYEELKTIGESVREKVVNYSEKGIEKKPREVAREAIDEYVAKAKSAQVAGTLPKIEFAGEEITDKTVKLKKLLDYAAEHGPVKASLAARKIGDPWLEDQLHDSLIKWLQS
ncbi:MAG: hypothetical protein HYS87_01275 [Candidatus Colwellbacteria bacterium]|nr:hypothetical protein [Candidatus Colwellbacteria bacterium]